MVNQIVSEGFDRFALGLLRFLLANKMCCPTAGVTKDGQKHLFSLIFETFFGLETNEIMVENQ